MFAYNGIEMIDNAQMMRELMLNEQMRWLAK